jgi:hypothetical protein
MARQAAGTQRVPEHEGHASRNGNSLREDRVERYEGIPDREQPVGSVPQPLVVVTTISGPPVDSDFNARRALVDERCE